MFFRAKADNARNGAGGDGNMTRRYAIAAVLFGLLVLAYIDRAALSVAAPAISARFGLSHAATGYLLSAFVWTYVIFILPVGDLVGRFGIKRVGGAGVVLWSLATVMTGVSTSFTALLFARLLLGVGETVCFPVAGRAIREWFPMKERGVISTLFNCGSSAGTAIGAPLTALLISAWDWRLAFVLLGVLGAAFLLAWAFWIASPPPGAESVPEKSPRAPEPASPLRYWDLVSMPAVWGLMLTQGCMVYTGYLFFSWIPSYLKSTLKLSTLQMGTFTTVPFLAAIVLGLICAAVTDRVRLGHGVGNRRFFIAGFMCLGLCMLLARFMHQSWSLLAVLSAVTLANNMTTGLNLALLNDLVENPRDSSKVAGLMVLCGNAFGLVAPIVTGYVVDETGGYDLAFSIAAGLLVLGAIACLTLSRHSIGPGNGARPALAPSLEPAR